MWEVIKTILASIGVGTVICFVCVIVLIVGFSKVKEDEGEYNE